LLKVIDGVWTASFVTGASPFFPIVATGGTVTEFTDPETGITYRVHSFTSVGSSTFTVSSLGTTSGEVEYLVVAGGGGGANGSGNVGNGGGGAGGYRCSCLGESSGGGNTAESPLVLSVGTYTAIVGDGGLGLPGSAARGTTAGSGQDSSFLGIISLGGGGATNAIDATIPSASGGSGGGGAYGTIPPGDGTINQGFAGGVGSSTPSAYGGGGGGGAGGIGGNGTSTARGVGGVGVSSSITGTSIVCGVGGDGGIRHGHFGDNATAIGSGGGGAGWESEPGGNGSPGIIVVRYAIAYP
jgi:hypothetical protein